MCVRSHTSRQLPSKVLLTLSLSESPFILQALPTQLLVNRTTSCSPRLHPSVYHISLINYLSDLCPPHIMVAYPCCPCDCTQTNPPRPLLLDRIWQLGSTIAYTVRLSVIFSCCSFISLILFPTDLASIEIICLVLSDIYKIVCVKSAYTDCASISLTSLCN